ncbi:GNAT family N-acetyltransferase [Gorillibacterium massiliense]|uniref:GNAT family N-acetyltransferase n=1 Tax=Gorillibacterium massiliense TaxID=1280390 RepID=UPI00059368AE
MTVLLFERDNRRLREEAADLLAECFPHAYGDCAMEEVDIILADGRIAVMALSGGNVVGLVGAMPRYGVTAWELHPLAVRASARMRGIGTKLLQALEAECSKRGGITLFLGSDDEFSQTTLSDTDLYVDTYAKIQGIRNLQGHPYEFYQKAGYAIVGVIPDANGLGKPDIWMAKRIASRLSS